MRSRVLLVFPPILMLMVFCGCGGQRLNGKYVHTEPAAKQDAYELHPDGTFVLRAGEGSPDGSGGTVDIIDKGKYEVNGTTIAFHCDPVFGVTTSWTGTLDGGALTIPKNSYNAGGTFKAESGGGTSGRYARIPDPGAEIAYTFKSDGSFIGPLGIEGKYEVSGNTVTFHLTALGTAMADTGTLKGDTITIGGMDYKQKK